nr:glycoside hydrolase family protein [Methylobacterium sp. OTU13CASTA1]
MAITAIGRAALIAREAVKTRAYKDSVGIWTIGVGHTSAAGPPKVTSGLVITEAEAMEIFARDLVKYETTVDASVKVPLADHERDALVSICYNIGQGSFAKSTFVKRLNAGDRAGCAEAIMAWKKPAEIIGRRTGERDQFLTDYATALPKARNTDRARVGAAASAKPATSRAAPAVLVSDDEAQPEFAIRGAQERLIALGFHDVGLVDGKKGRKFASAVRQLQERAVALGDRVTVDGLYGPHTRALLDEKHGDRYRNVVSAERAHITAADLSRIGNPAVVQGRRIQWSAVGGFLASLASVGMLAVQNYQAGTDTLPWAVQAALNFMPPWVAMVAPMAFALYNAAVAKGLVGTAVERVREGIDNSGAPPAAGPGGLFGSLFGGR